MYRSSSSDAANDIDVAALWHAIWDRKLLILSAVLIVGAATYTILSLLTPQYSSEARILIDNDESAFTRPTNGQRTSVPIDPEAVASQVQVVLSRDLALEVIRSLELNKKPAFNPALRKISPVKALLASIGLAKKKKPEDKLETVLDAFQDQLQVQQIHKSRVISVRVTSSDKALSAVVANKLAETYLSWQQRDRLGQTKNASTWLQDQIETLRKKVSDSEAAAARFRSATGIVSGENNVTLSSQELSELNSQLILAQAQRSEAEARARLIKKMLRDKGDVASAPDVVASELIRNLLEQRVALQRRLAETSATLLPSHPRIKQLKSELANLRTQIRKEARNIVGSLESAAQIAGAREASLKANLAKLKTSKSAVSQDEVKLKGLEREAQVNRELLESYLTRHTDASARNDFMSVPAYASIISRAGVARNPSFPKKKLMTSLAMAATGFLLVAFFLTRELIVSQSASIRAAQTNPSNDFVEVRDALQARHSDIVPQREPVVAAQAAEIYAPPPAPPEPASPVVQFESGAAMSLGRITDMLHERGAGRTLVVAARRSVDATSEALELTRSMARASQRAILVDLPETSDGLTAQLGFSGSQGIGELVSGIAGFEDVVRRDPKSPAHVMLRGHPRLNPAHKGEDAAFSSVLAALDQTYDQVVMHANGSAALNLLHRFADGFSSVVLVASDDQPARGASWSEVERHLSELGIGHKVIRYERPRRPEGVFARLPMMNRVAS